MLLLGNADDMLLLVTYVDEIRSVLTCHPKPKISPESRLLPYYLDITKEQARSVLMTFVAIHSGKFLFIILPYQLLLKGGWMSVVVINN